MPSFESGLTHEKCLEKSSRQFIDMAGKIFAIKDKLGFFPAVNQVFNDFGLSAIKPDAERQRVKKQWLDKVVPVIKKLEHGRKKKMIEGATSLQMQEENRAGQSYDESDLN